MNIDKNYQIVSNAKLQEKNDQHSFIWCLLSKSVFKKFKVKTYENF